MPGLVEGGVYNPRSNRGCTDILCLLLLFGVIGGLAAILILSIQREPDVINMLRYAQDDYGQFCGRPGSATADLPCVLYPTLDEDLKSQAAEAATMPFWKYYSIKLTSICVESCPDGIALSEPVPVYGGEDYPTGDATRDDSGWLAEGTTPEFYFSLRTVNLGGRCLPYSNSFEAPEQILCVSPSCTAAKSMGIGVTECAAVPTRDGADETWEVLTDAQKEACEAKVRVDTAQTFRSADGDDETDALTRKLASYVALTLAFAESVFDSLSTVLVLGVAMPVLLGFVYAMLLYFLAGLVIWLLVTLLILGMCFLDFLLCAHAGWIVLPSWLVGPANSTAVLSGSGAEVALLGGDSSASNEDLYGFLAVVALAVTLMLLLWICFSYKAIVRTIAITEEATKVFSTLPALMVWPFVELTFLIGALVYGIFALAVICHPSVWGGDSLTALFAVCQVAGTLWMIQFIHACDYTTMSAAVAYWFVTTNAQNDGCCGAEKCCKGWVAFCGVPKLLDAAWTAGADGNCLVKMAFRCAMCALWCLEKSIEFVSYYAYVNIAIDGTCFCVACKDTFGLIIKYPAQTAVNNLVKRLLCGVLLGLSTPCIAAVATFLYLDGQEDFTEKHTPIYPAGTVFVLAFFVAGGISNVFEAILDTVYLCAFQDMDLNSPPIYLSDSMREALGVDAAEEEAGKSADYYKKASSDAGRGKVQPSVGGPGGSML